MKYPLLFALALVPLCLLAEDPKTVLGQGEKVTLTRKQEVDVTAPPHKEIPGAPVLYKVQMEAKGGGGIPPFYLVSGRVVSNNTGGALGRIPIFTGAEGMQPTLVALTNAEGEFKIRWWTDQARDGGDFLPADLSGSLYVGGGGWVALHMRDMSGLGVMYRYSLKRLSEIAKTADPAAPAMLPNGWHDVPSKDGERVELLSKGEVDVKPEAERPGREIFLGSIQMEADPDSSPPSFIVSGKVGTDNKEWSLEGVSIHIGAEGGMPTLRAMANLDGEFKFRLWIEEKRTSFRISVPPDFPGYLYVGGTLLGNDPGGHLFTTRRYSLKKLFEVTQAAAK